MNEHARIYVAGHRGLVGSAIVRRLERDGYTALLTRTKAEMDLRDPAAVRRFFRSESPQLVILAAAKVGGIYANDTYPAEFIRDNLLIQTNVIDAAYRQGCEKLLFLGSSCVYPKHAPQPIKEKYLLTGSLETTNEPYAVAKIAGIKMCQAYRRQYGFNAITLMPTNLYGPGDNFDLKRSHVVPALIRKFHEAKQARSPTATVWGTGRSLRELLHVDDFADAAVFLMRAYDEPELLNVGCGRDISIADLAKRVAEAVGFEGTIHFDRTMPDGTGRKVLNVDRLTALGWRPRIGLREGLARTYEWFLRNASETSENGRELRWQQPAPFA